MVTNEQTNKQPGEPRASLLVEHWAKQTFATKCDFETSESKMFHFNFAQPTNFTGKGHWRNLWSPTETWSWSFRLWEEIPGCLWREDKLWRSSFQSTTTSLFQRWNKFRVVIFHWLSQRLLMNLFSVRPVEILYGASVSRYNLLWSILNFTKVNCSYKFVSKCLKIKGEDTKQFPCLAHHCRASPVKGAKWLFTNGATPMLSIHARGQCKHIFKVFFTV